MAKKNFAHVPYVFCYGACQPSVASFKLADGVWVKALDSAGKTPFVVACWAADQHQPHPVWVVWEKPETIGKVGQYEENEVWFGPCKAYARTTASALLFGETVPRRLQVTFTWRYSVYQDRGQVFPNLPETNGGGWEVEDLGPDTSYREDKDGRTFPIWEDGEQQLATT